MTAFHCEDFAIVAVSDQYAETDYAGVAEVPEVKIKIFSEPKTLLKLKLFTIQSKV